MNKKVVVIAVVLSALIGISAYKLMQREETGITATGTIELTQGDVMPKVNGYLKELNIAVGDKVKAGQVIATLRRPDLEAQLQADQAMLARLKVQLTDLEKGPREQEKTGAAANLAAARAVYQKASLDLKRNQELLASGAIAQQQLDTLQSAYDVAYNNLTAAKAQQSLIEEGNRPDVIAAQKMDIQRYEAVVAATASQLADTMIYSPLDGVVLSKNFVGGEYVNPGSAIATIGDTNDCWVKIYVSSEQLGLIALDQPVSVKIDAYPQRVFNGTIKEISQKAEFTPRQSITKRERANLVFYVKVRVDNSEGILKAGMPADVIIK